MRPFGGQTNSDWYSDVLVNNQGGAEKVEVVPRTHARWREGDQLDSSSGVTRPALLAPAQTIRTLQASLVEQNLLDLFETPNPDDDEIDYGKTEAFAPFLAF